MLYIYVSDWMQIQNWPWSHVGPRHKYCPDLCSAEAVHGHLNVEWLFQNQVMNVHAASGSVTLLKHDFLSIYDMSTNVLFPMF